MEGRRKEAVGHTPWNPKLASHTSHIVCQIVTPCNVQNQQSSPCHCEDRGSERSSPHDASQSSQKSENDATGSQLISVYDAPATQQIAKLGALVTQKTRRTGDQKE